MKWHSDKVSSVIIYHNGTCSKCKGALELLQEMNVPHEVRFYIAEPLSGTELARLLDKLNLPPEALIRKDEPLFREQYEGRNIGDREWLELLLRHPELMQRPIVERGGKAIIARPPAKVLELLE